MDEKDRIYTKRMKELSKTVREIIKKRSNLIPKVKDDIEMIIDYFSYAIIYG